MPHEPGHSPAEAVQEAVEGVAGIVDGGGDGGGGGGGGGGDGGAAQARRQGFRGLLFRLRLQPGLFEDIISQAVAGEWSGDEFLWAVSTSDAFLRQFPGITALFDRGMSVPQAVSTWRGMADAYGQVARDMGLVQVAKLSPKRVGFLISGGVDAEEFAVRLSILDYAKRTQASREAFNRILKSRAEQELDEKGWFRFLMGRSERRLYDLYEGTILLQQLGPEGLRVREARQLARSLGGPGAPANLVDFTSAIENIRTELGSEQLRQAGIRPADLALAALRDQLQTADARERAGRVLASLEQMLANREAASVAIDRTGVIVRGGRPISEAAPQGELAG